MLTLSLLLMNPGCLNSLLSLLKLARLQKSYKNKQELKLKSVRLRKILLNSWKLLWTSTPKTLPLLRKRPLKTKSFKRRLLRIKLQSRRSKSKERLLMKKLKQNRLLNKAKLKKSQQPNDL